MPKQKRRKRKSASIAVKPARRLVPLTGKQRRVLRVVAGITIATGVVMLVKVVATLMGDTAWEAGMSASREADPFGYWAFVVSYLVLGGGMTWLGVSFWRER